MDLLGERQHLRPSGNREVIFCFDRREKIRDIRQTPYKNNTDSLAHALQ